MDLQKIGSCLRELRKEKGLTQEQLAERFHVSGKTVSRWENGVHMPDLELLLEIADYYEVDLRALLQGRKINNKTTPETKETVQESEKYIKAKDKKKRKLAVGIIVTVAILLAAMLLLLVKFDDYSIIEKEQNTFRNAYNENSFMLKQLIDSLNTVEGEYSVIISKGEAGFDSSSSIETDNDNRALLQYIGSITTEMFGDRVSISKRTDQGKTVIVIRKVYDIARNPCRHSWIETSMWYCDDKTSSMVQQAIEYYGNQMIWLDQNYAIITTGLV